MALYPIRLLKDKNMHPFFPFNTIDSVLVDGTDLTLHDLLNNIYTKTEVNNMFATELSKFSVYDSVSELPQTARDGAVAAVDNDDTYIMYIFYENSWHSLTQKGDTGDTGPQGPQGIQGIQGVQGPAATINVGTTTTGQPGTDASVTNSGTTSAAVFDFVIPKGEKGDTAYPVWGNITGDVNDQTDLQTIIPITAGYKIYFLDGDATTEIQEAQGETIYNAYRNGEKFIVVLRKTIKGPHGTIYSDIDYIEMVLLTHWEEITTHQGTFLRSVTIIFKTFDQQYGTSSIIQTIKFSTNIYNNPGDKHVTITPSYDYSQFLDCHVDYTYIYTPQYLGSPATKKYVDDAILNFAPAYDNTATYDINDYVVFYNVLYKCTTAITTAEDWDNTHWTQTTVAEMIGN